MKVKSRFPWSGSHWSPAARAHSAVKQAVLAARKDRGHMEWFGLRSPATVEPLREACLVVSADLNLEP